MEVGQVPGDQVTREVGQVGWTRNMSRVKNTCLAYHDRQVRRRLVQGRLASVDSDVGRQGGARLSCLTSFGVSTQTHPIVNIATDYFLAK